MVSQLCVAQRVSIIHQTSRFSCPGTQFRGFALRAQHFHSQIVQFPWQICRSVVIVLLDVDEKGLSRGLKKQETPGQEFPDNIIIWFCLAALTLCIPWKFGEHVSEDTS